MWFAAADGGVFTVGDARFHGFLGALHLDAPVVGIAATPDGGGYWLVAGDGGVFTFGDARFHGSLGALHLNAPVVGIAATPDGGGYWLRRGGRWRVHLRGRTFPRIPRCPAPRRARRRHRRHPRRSWLPAGGRRRRRVLPRGRPFRGIRSRRGDESRRRRVARTLDGLGYWLLTSAGQVVPLGDAVGFAPPRGAPAPGTYVGIVAART